MNTLTIGFSKPKRFFPIFSWIIRAVLGTKYSHVYVKSRTRYGVDLVYQASGSAVNFMNDQVFYAHNEVIKEYPVVVSDEAFTHYMTYALTNVGRPYSLRQAFGLMLVVWFSLERNPFPNGPENFVCSEIVAGILSELSLYKIEKARLDCATPKDLWTLCLKLNNSNLGG